MTETPEVPDSPETSPKFLSDIQLDLVFFVERYHASNGDAPTDANILQRFTGISQDDIDAFKSNPLVLRSMAARGIPYPHAGDKFTARQMAAAASMLAYTDRRSDEKKLRDIGVTPREWAGWLQDEEFGSYLRERSERMLVNSQHEANLGLVRSVRNGNMASIKYMNQMTGRYDPDQEAQINVRVLLHKFIEVIQREVKDPLAMHRIATALSNVASRESMGQALGRTILDGTDQFNSNPIIKGEIQ